MHTSCTLNWLDINFLAPTVGKGLHINPILTPPKFFCLLIESSLSLLCITFDLHSDYCSFCLDPVSTTLLLCILTRMYFYDNMAICYHVPCPSRSWHPVIPLAFAGVKQLYCMSKVTHKMTCQLKSAVPRALLCYGFDFVYLILH